MYTKDIFFHGSKALFNKFAPQFHGTGEGAGNDFRGWFFCDKPWGAIKHVQSYLRDLPGEGYLYVCKIDSKALIPNCENGGTDSIYGNQAYGVELNNSHHIEIVEVISLKDLDASLIKRNQEYQATLVEQPLHGGPLSILRAVE